MLITFPYGVSGTVPSCNSCTEYPGMKNHHTPDCHPVYRAWIDVALIHKLLGSMMCLAFFDMLSMGV